VVYLFLLGGLLGVRLVATTNFGAVEVSGVCSTAREVGCGDGLGPFFLWALRVT
jgi:hypothetical protein